MKILIITDYKGYFGSKQNSLQYRSGMDIGVITKHLEDNGFQVQVLEMTSIQFVMDEIIQDRPIVLYQSAEDLNGHYKSFIEDVIYDLERRDLVVLPKFDYLKAHHNKVAMELFRLRINSEELISISSSVFGTLEEAMNKKNEFLYPVVVKTFAGCKSRGVYLAKNEGELKKYVKKISKSKSFLKDLKDFLRFFKYKFHYKKESTYRKKFIVQNLIPNLKDDWKVLVYDNRCYVLNRSVLQNDFRASGSGKFKFVTDLPEGLLDFSYKMKTIFDVPHVSLDIAYDGNRFHLLEFQCVLFGTTTLEKSEFFFERDESSSWKRVDEKPDLEKVYVSSIVNYLKEKNEGTFC